MGTRRATLTAISAGLALAVCCFPLMAEVVGALGLWSVAAVAVAGGLCWWVSRAYAELAGMFPTAAGVRTYVGRAFGDERGLSLSVLYLFLVVSLGAAETCILSEVLRAVFPQVPPLPVILTVIGGCAAVNLLGFEPAGRLQALATYAILGSVASLSLAALAAGSGGQGVSLMAPPDAGGLAIGVASAVFLFVGFEWVVNTSEDTGDGGAALPAAMGWAIAALTGVYMLLAAALALGLPASQLGWNPVAHVALARSGLGAVGGWIAVAVSIAATLTSFNSGILGASRLLYALGREGVAPRGLGALHPRSLTPARAILTITAVTTISALTLAFAGIYEVPVVVGGAIECVVFAAVALSLRRLRETHPDHPRPYRAPIGPLGAVVLAVIFALLAIGSLLSSPLALFVFALFVALALFQTHTWAFFDALKSRT